MNKEDYARELQTLQVELVYLQEWIKAKGVKLVVIFEGRDAAGKGGAIKAITDKLNPRIVRVAALGKPSDKERHQWYFQRFVEHLPAAGEMVLFDRSWYNRAGVEKVMGFCSDEEYRDFLMDCPDFERMLQRSGIVLIKYWFAISEQVQEKRFLARLEDPVKRWKFSDMDLISRSHWAEYTQCRDKMFAHTDTEDCPWYVVDADHGRLARLNCISHLLSLLPYERLPFPKVKLPKLQKEDTYEHGLSTYRQVPQKYR